MQCFLRHKKNRPQVAAGLRIIVYLACPSRLWSPRRLSLAGTADQRLPGMTAFLQHCGVYGIRGVVCVVCVQCVVRRISDALPARNETLQSVRTRTMNCKPYAIQDFVVTA